VTFGAHWYRENPDPVTKIPRYELLVTSVTDQQTRHDQVKHFSK